MTRWLVNVLVSDVKLVDPENWHIAGNSVLSVEQRRTPGIAIPNPEIHLLNHRTAGVKRHPIPVPQRSCCQPKPLRPQGA